MKRRGTGAGRRPRVTERSAPEYASIDAFVEFCLDDDRDTFSADDLAWLAYRLERSRGVIRADLESWGLTLAARAPERRVRGVGSNDHDRWIAYRV